MSSALHYPATRPQWGGSPAGMAEKVRAALMREGVTDAAALLGVRAYRRDTMGKPGVNDFGIYDDAIFLKAPSGEVTAFNANTDPSVLGWNAALGKPYAQLKCGVWPFIRGLHRGDYPALRQPTPEQAAPRHLACHGFFTVIRNPNNGRGEPYEETGYFAINIHRGGAVGTSSWGCQTLPPPEWHEFISGVYRAMDAAEQRVIRYCLIEGPVC